jgi:hypothetical protein
MSAGLLAFDHTLPLGVLVLVLVLVVDEKLFLRERSEIPFVFSLIFLTAELALVGLFFLGRSSISASILRGLSVAGERLIPNKGPYDCEKIVMGENLLLEGVLGLDEESALTCAMDGILEAAMIHDLRGMEEAECCW